MSNLILCKCLLEQTKSVTIGSIRVIRVSILPVSTFLGSRKSSEQL